MNQVQQNVLIFALICLGLYLLPTIIAFIRHHTQRFAIFALNLFLGWTLLGWVGSLVWACTYSNYSRSTHTEPTKRTDSNFGIAILVILAIIILAASFK